jgi:predicted outer membrane repeat protein
MPEKVKPSKSIQQFFIPALVVVAVGLAFFSGLLFQENKSLKSGGAVAGNGVGASPTAAPTVDINSAGGVGHFPVQGDANAKVTIIEFADFRCPYCEQFSSQTMPQIVTNYINTGKAKFAFRNYAFLGSASTVAADASECANDQGKFWAFHDYLYKNQPDESNTTMYNTDTLTKEAAALGMDGTKFSNCLSSKADDAKVQQDLADGQKAGVSGTPAFFINGTFINGAEPYSVFQQAIDAALK